MASPGSPGPGRAEAGSPVEVTRRRSIDGGRVLRPRMSTNAEGVGHLMTVGADAWSAYAVAADCCRALLMSRRGGLPNILRYSRVNWGTLS